MNFSIEIGLNADLETLPPVKDVYITLLPGGDYTKTAEKAADLVNKGFNPVPHFPARSIVDETQLKDYVSRCKDFGVKQVITHVNTTDYYKVIKKMLFRLETTVCSIKSSMKKRLTLLSAAEPSYFTW